MQLNSRSTSSAASVGDDFRCRLCLRMGGSELRPLFPPGEDQIELMSRIFDCLAVHISFLYDFNSMMCGDCREKIGTFYVFKKQCQSNDEYVRRKRSNLVVGPEFERRDTLFGGVKEAGIDALLKDVKDIFAPKGKEEEEEDDVKMPELAVESPDAELEVVEIPSSSGHSNESFCGFSLETYARRSPRIFIQKSVTEATERQQPAAIRECRILLNKLDPKLDLPMIADDETPVELPKLTKIEPKMVRPRARIPEGAATGRVKQHRRKAVLYYQGFQFARPKRCPTGGFMWSCCKTHCPVKLNDGTREISAGPHQHEAHVKREGTIMNIRRKRLVPFLLAKFGRCLSFVYDNAYRFQYLRELPNNQQMWICEAAQTDGCSAYVKIVGDFTGVSCVYKHNHPEAKMILEEPEADVKD